MEVNQRGVVEDISRYRCLVHDPGGFVWARAHIVECKSAIQRGPRDVKQGPKDCISNNKHNYELYLRDDGHEDSKAKGDPRRSNVACTIRQERAVSRVTDPFESFMR